MEEFDAIVIGTGQAGTPLAKDLGGAGLRTAIIERGRVGGTCVIDGCTPTKTMIASARVAHLVRRSEKFGVERGDVGIRMNVVRERKREIVDSFSEGVRTSLRDADGVTLMSGTARFTSDHTLEVRNGDTPPRALTAPRIFVNTGSRTDVPQVAGLSEVPWLDHASVMELESVPEHLVILGGGFIGLEFAQMFLRFGAEVTVVEAADQVLSGEDPDVVECVTTVLRDEGVRIRLRTRVESMRPAGEGIRLQLIGPDGDETVEASHLMIAAGRRPNTDDLGLENTGIETSDEGYVTVDGSLRTTVDGVWALGEVNGGPPFTHVAYDDYRIVRRNVLGPGGGDRKGRLLPYTLFTDPQLGRVGLSETEAKERDTEVRVISVPTSKLARAQETAETRGFVKVVLDASAERILGAAVLTPQGGEIAAMIQLAMMGNLRPEALRDGVFSHPSWAESLNTLFEDLKE